MTATLRTAGSLGYPVHDFSPSRSLPSQAALARFAKTVKNIALFAAAPFIGLVYAMLLPFVGLGMLAVIGSKALAKEPAAYRVLVAARKIALIAAAPFIGLVYAVLMPFFGMVMIAKIGYQAYRAPSQVA